MPARHPYRASGLVQSVLCAVEHKTDRATDEHGDMLDVIRERRGLSTFADVLDEARNFLALPHPKLDLARTRRGDPDQYDRRKTLLRINAGIYPLSGSIAETYLRSRGLDRLCDCAALRFHPRCFCRDDNGPASQRRPALIAIVTDLAGTTVGIHRTYLADDRLAKAPIRTPRRSLGPILGHGVRFGLAVDVIAAGEGIETTLSLKCAVPAMPMLAALSASNLAALLFPTKLKRLYVARDDDDAGDRATAVLCDRARRQGVQAIALNPRLGDFNDDLRAFGLAVLQANVADQLAPEDVVRFIADPTDNR